MQFDFKANNVVAAHKTNVQQKFLHVCTSTDIPLKSYFNAVVCMRYTTLTFHTIFVPTIYKNPYTQKHSPQRKAIRPNLFIRKNTHHNNTIRKIYNVKKLGIDSYRIWPCWCIQHRCICTTQQNHTHFFFVHCNPFVFGGRDRHYRL